MCWIIQPQLQTRSKCESGGNFCMKVQREAGASCGSSHGPKRAQEAWLKAWGAQPVLIGWFVSWPECWGVWMTDPGAQAGFGVTWTLLAASPKQFSPNLLQFSLEERHRISFQYLVLLSKSIFFPLFVFKLHFGLYSVHILFWVSECSFLDWLMDTPCPLLIRNDLIVGKSPPAVKSHSHLPCRHRLSSF